MPHVQMSSPTYYSEKIEHAETPRINLNDGRAIPVIGESISNILLGRVTTGSRGREELADRRGRLGMLSQDRG